MRLNRMLRFLARKLLGGDVLGQASWEKAEYNLRSAAELAPEDAVNHLELGMALRDLDRPEEARQAFQRAALTVPRRAADRRHIQRALTLLAESSG
jgi:Flp pilus assembly protein TadD